MRTSANTVASGHRSTGHRRVAGRPARLALVGWAALVLATFAWGRWMWDAGALRLDRFPPLFGFPRVQTWQLLPAIAVAAGLVAALPVAARRLRWGMLLAGCWLATLGWTVALAASDGLDHLTVSFAEPSDYLPIVPVIGDDPVGWLRGFTEALPGYPTHVKGHPPLPGLLMWGLDRIGLGGPWPAAALVILAGTAAVVAVAVTLRRLAGEGAARAALPYLVLGPWAVWVATSMDALFLGVCAWGVALLVLAAGAGRRVWWAVPAGLLLGAAPYLNYGLLPFVAVAVAAAWAARVRPAAAAVALASAVTVTAGFVAAGFFYPDGVRATHAAWAAGLGSQRPYWYFLFGNLAVFALMIGPAVAAALPRALGRAVRELRAAGPGARPAHLGARPASSGGRTRGWGDRLRSGVPAPAVPGLLAAAALVAVLALDVSGFTRGEVQRIWLPYAVWAGAAAAVLPRHRLALAGQAVVGIALQGLLRSLW